MKLEDIKALTDAELSAKITEESSAYHKLKFAHSISPLENPMKVRSQRKLVARLNTEFNARKK